MSVCVSLCDWWRVGWLHKSQGLDESLENSSSTPLSQSQPPHPPQVHLSSQALAALSPRGQSEDAEARAG